jgi:hypothetical protein
VFGIEQALPLEAVATAGGRSLLPLAALLPELPIVRVGPEGRAALRHGRGLDRGLVIEGFPTEPPPRLRVLDDAGALVAVVVPRGFAALPSELKTTPTLHPELVLVD